MAVVKEYRDMERQRAAWGNGPWMHEPDKVQGIDEATDYDFLIVRNNIGALCGYVGVPESHPAYGKDYNDVNVDVHGGLTFARSCSKTTHERWEQWRASMVKQQAEIAKYPKGDSAANWRDQGHLIDDYDGWCAWMESAAICHVPLAGRSDNIWWLGFDCAHACDHVPGISITARGFSGGEYRDRAYVMKEIAHLATQLKALEN